MTGLPDAGVCFGFEARTTLPLQLTRPAGRSRATPLGVTLHDLDPTDPNDPAGGPLRLLWRPPRHPFHARLYGSAPTYRLWIGGSGWFVIDTAAPHVGVPRLDTTLRREERLWGLPALLCFAARGDLGLHACAVEVDGAALVVAAPGRYGKTTLAAAMVRRGHRLLAEDLVCVRSGPEPLVVPGPTVLRLRHDSARRLGTDWAQLAAADDDRLHLVPGGAGDGDPVPLRALVVLREPTAEPSAEPAAPEAVLADLWSLAFHLPEDEDRIRVFEGIATVLRTVAAWNLPRSARFGGIDDDVARLEGLAARSHAR